jgi:diaminopimelate decarboxylase
MNYLNIGGGLAIDYLHQEDECKKISTKNNLIVAAASSLPSDLDLIIEPGRSIMATTGIQQPGT